MKELFFAFLLHPSKLQAFKNVYGAALQIIHLTINNMRPVVKTLFFEDIQSINTFARQILDGSVMLCETLFDCAQAMKKVENGEFDQSGFKEVTLFIMPELQLQLLSIKAQEDNAVEAARELLKQ